MTEPQAPAPLPPESLYRHCDPAQFSFETTSDLDAKTQILGQPRAVEAVRFGIGMHRTGYNIFAAGPAGTGRKALVHHFVEERAGNMPVPSDWSYIHNFEDPRRPNALPLPSGKGAAFKDDVAHLIDDLQAALEAAFDSEDFQMRKQMVQEEARQKEETALEDLQKRAGNENVALLRTPTGFAFAPLKDGNVVTPQELGKLDEAEKKRIQDLVEGFQEELVKILRQVPKRMRALREQLRTLNREVAEYAMGDLFNALLQKYQALEEVAAHLQTVREDLLENIDAFLHQQQEDGVVMQDGSTPSEKTAAFSLRRYYVNVIVDNGSTEGAPVIYEDNPNYQNLIGHIEQIAQMGTLMTDFNLIQPGALHRANGGFLVIEARKLLMQPFAWEGLKRALFAGTTRIESPGEALGLISTVMLEPEPIPLDVKIVLVGDPFLYYLLSTYDPDFSELFKVMADFDDHLDWNPEHQRLYAEMLAYIIGKESMKPLDRSAVGRVIEHSARLAGDAEKMTTHLQSITDLIREADYWAAETSAAVITAAHVQQALDAQIFRADRIRARMQEEIQRETIFISTEGETIGQINGLAVLQLGGFAFGKPSRITARVHLGEGDVLDIEREVEMGGPLHSKGMLILTGFLGGRYAQEQPLSLSASLVFEQSYGGVDGDSASSAELYALLSAIAEVPIRQSFAVTGSVNQYGQVQPIGGVNEKIEGFFDVCKARGLTGDQGVLIPAANVKHLMLRADVVEAVRAGQFHVYPVTTIDEGIALLTGRPAGMRGEDGLYPEDTVNHRVLQRLSAFSERRKTFAQLQGKNGMTDV